MRLQIGFLIIAPIRLAGRGGSVHRPPFLAGYPLDTSGEAGRNRSSGKWQTAWKQFGKRNSRSRICVLFDVGLPTLNGIEAARQIRRKQRVCCEHF